MTTTEAFPIIAQIAAGLVAAHEAGIVHRDFKSANVVLVPSKRGAEDVRAVVTDFGLARGTSAGDSFAVSLCGIGDFAGTPAYMAPEQVRGGEITPAVDIYALGVVMYEMLTGHWPFAGDTPLAAAIKRLEEPPRPPRAYVPDLDPRWEGVILRCLERDPTDRFASAVDVVRTLGGEEFPAARKALAEKKPRWRWFALVGSLLVLLLASAVIYHLRAPRTVQQTVPSQATGLPPRPINARRSVAVLGFKNLSGQGETAWLSTALSEMLTTELAAGEKLRTIAGENVAQMKINLSLAEADSYSKETLARIRSNLGADLVVLGTYVALGEKAGGQIRLDLRLQDAVAGETMAATVETGTEAKLFELVSQAGAHLREKLGVGEVTAAETDTVKASLPSNPEAVRLYAEGLAKLRQFDALAARDLLEKAVAADPHHALAHSALADAWQTLGYDTKAQAEAKQAFTLSANLSRETRLAIEGLYRVMTHEPEKAVEVYRILWGFFPDNPDYGIRLAQAQTSAGQGKDALATLEALRKLPSPIRDDPRIDVQESMTARAMSDAKRELAAAAEAAAKGRTQGARLLVALARTMEGRAYWDLGQYEQARSALEEGKRIFAAAGDGFGVGRALNVMAVVLQEQGNLSAAAETYKESIEALRKVGNKLVLASALSNLGTLLEAEGKLSEAKEMYQVALGIGREIGNKSLAGTEMDCIANVLLAEGNLGAAKQAYFESLKIHREIGDRKSVGFDLSNLAALAERQGEIKGAIQFSGESLKIFRGIGYKYGMARDLTNMAGYLMERDNLSTAKEKAEESLAIYKEMGNPTGISDDLMMLALVAVEEKRFVQAEAQAKQAAQEYRSENASTNEAFALGIAAESLLRQGRLVEAQSTIDRAAMVAQKSDDRATRLWVAIMGARVRAATGKPAEAMEALATVLAEATKLGLVDYQFESRLALGEIEMKSGKPAAGRARLETLQKEAKAKGFGLIARKAAAVRE